MASNAKAEQKLQGFKCTFTATIYVGGVDKKAAEDMIPRF
jgi:hypothetical protein